MNERRSNAAGRPRRGARAALAFAIALAGLGASPLAGCVVHRQSASVAPGVDAAALRRFLVVPSPDDERGVAAVIVADLRRRGLEAATGPAPATPGSVDAVVTYQARWQWDLEYYLLELRVFLREPGSDALLATGAAYHTSLGRKSPEEMVSEVVSGLLRAAREGRNP